MREFRVDYERFFDLRRERVIKKFAPPTVFFKEYDNGEYDIWMNIEGTMICCFLNSFDTGLISDFESTKKQYCGKMNYPKSLELRSHDFANETSWNNPSDSSYITDLENGFVFRLKRILLTTDKDSEIANNSNIKMCIWTGINGACPNKGISRTPYGASSEPPVLVGQNVQSGWLEIAPTYQAFKQHIYFLDFIPQYIVTEFTYPTIEDLSVQAEQTVYNNTMKLEFPYMKNGIRDILLRTSMNERIELFIDSDTKLNRPNRMLETGFDVPSICAFMFDKYEEF